MIRSVCTVTIARRESRETDRRIGPKHTEAKQVHSKYLMFKHKTQKGLWMVRLTQIKTNYSVQWKQTKTSRILNLLEPGRKSKNNASIQEQAGTLGPGDKDGPTKTEAKT